MLHEPLSRYVFPWMPTRVTYRLENYPAHLKRGIDELDSATHTIYLFKSLEISDLMVSMGRGFGFGKVILFGEHFVVHGVPGIAAAIDLTTEAEVKKTQDGITIKDERRSAEGYAEKKKTQQKESIQRIFETMGIDSEKASLEIWIGGNLPGLAELEPPQQVALQSLEP